MSKSKTNLSLIGAGAAKKALENFRQREKYKNVNVIYEQDISVNVRETEAGFYVTAITKRPDFGGRTVSFRRYVNGEKYLKNALSRCYFEAWQTVKDWKPAEKLYNDFKARAGKAINNPAFAELAEQAEKESGFTCLYAKMKPEAVTFWRKWLEETLPKFETGEKSNAK